MKVTNLQIRRVINRILREVNEYNWELANKKRFMLDKEGMEKSDKENVEQYLKKMGLMEEKI